MVCPTGLLAALGRLPHVPSSRRRSGLLCPRRPREHAQCHFKPWRVPSSVVLLIYYLHHLLPLGIREMHFWMNPESFHDWNLQGALSAERGLRHGRRCALQSCPRGGCGVQAQRLITSATRTAHLLHFRGYTTRRLLFCRFTDLLLDLA